MNHDFAQTKLLLQQFVDQQYSDWLKTYSPIKLTPKALKKESEKDDSYFWTTGDEFIHEYILLSNGQEVSTSSITIEPGISESDHFWKSPKSWKEDNDEGSVIFLEVVVQCIACEGGAKKTENPCTQCGDSGEWVFLPKELKSNL